MYYLNKTMYLLFTNVRLDEKMITNEKGIASII